MSTELYRELAWLPREPDDFADRLKQLADAPDWGVAVRRLAGHGLGEARIGRLGNAITKRLAAGKPVAPLLPFRLGLVGNGTLTALVPALVGTFARHGFALEVIAGDYDRIVPEAIDPASRINAARPDAVLVALDWHG
ncbi:MAG: hypothetical protein ACRYG4_23255, partial [Janthinobacterium lividum]